MRFEDIKKPDMIAQKHIWVAEEQGRILAEFDLKTGKPNNFYSIDKDKLNRFGLANKDSINYIKCENGAFVLNGNVYTFSYFVPKTGDIYHLTDFAHPSRDIITYKKAYAELDISKKSGTAETTNILGYYFGYKNSFTINGILFRFKPIVTYYIDQKDCIDIYLSSDHELKGELIFYKNSIEVDRMFAPLREGKTGNVKWIIK